MPVTLDSRSIYGESIFLSANAQKWLETIVYIKLLKEVTNENIGIPILQ